MYYFLFCHIIIFSSRLSRARNAGDQSFKIQQYGATTGTSSLRRHLMNEHLADWVSGCDRMQVPIKAKEAQEVVKEYRKSNMLGSIVDDMPSDEPEKKDYSPAAFVDALVAWIVSDDQVTVASISLPPSYYIDSCSFFCISC